MEKIEQVIEGLYSDSTILGSGHVIFIAVGLTTPPPWAIIDKNKRELVVSKNII